MEKLQKPMKEVREFWKRPDADMQFREKQAKCSLSLAVRKKESKQQLPNFSLPADKIRVLP